MYAIRSYYGPDAVRIHPGVTTLQTAAARMGLPWHDIRVVSLHGRADHARNNFV